MASASKQLYDTIIIGAGHNGLNAAAYLARAGNSTLVLERRDIGGGCCVTEPIAPGCRASTTSYIASMLRPEVIRDLKLADHAARFLRTRHGRHGCDHRCDGHRRPCLRQVEEKKTMERRASSPVSVCRLRVARAFLPACVARTLLSAPPPPNNSIRRDAACRVFLPLPYVRIIGRRRRGPDDTRT